MMTSLMTSLLASLMAALMTSRIALPSRFLHTPPFPLPSHTFLPASFTPLSSRFLHTPSFPLPAVRAPAAPCRRLCQGLTSAQARSP